MDSRSLQRAAVSVEAIIFLLCDGSLTDATCSSFAVGWCSGGAYERLEQAGAVCCYFSFFRKHLKLEICLLVISSQLSQKCRTINSVPVFSNKFFFSTVALSYVCQREGSNDEQIVAARGKVASQTKTHLQTWAKKKNPITSIKALIC